MAGDNLSRLTKCSDIPVFAHIIEEVMDDTPHRSAAGPLVKLAYFFMRRNYTAYRVRDQADHRTKDVKSIDI